MNDVFIRWLDYSTQSPWQSLLMVVSTQLACLVLTGWLVARWMRQHSAAARHLVWASVLSCCLGLVPARLWLPQPTIDVFDPISAETDLPAAENAFKSQSGPAHHSTTRVLEPHHLQSDLHGEFGSRLDIAATAIDEPQNSDLTSTVLAGGTPDSPQALSASAGLAPSQAAPNQASSPIDSLPTSYVSIQPMTLVWSCYLLGASINILLAWIGWNRLRQLSQTGAAMSPRGKELASQCANSLGMRRQPNVVKSDSVSIPMTWGAFSPQILLPSDFESLDETSQRNCLTHEMAHIVRHDNVWSWVSVLATSLYWFHPAIHIAARHLKQTREDATDDMVILTGVNRNRYASTLLEMTTRASGDRSPVPAVAMASTLPIETRLRRILDRNANRSGLTPVGRIAIISVLATLSAAGIRLSSVDAQPPTPAALSAQALDLDSLTDSFSGATYYERMKATELANGDPDGLVFTVRGKVLGPQGAPVAGAIVVLRESSTYRLSRSIGPRPVNSLAPWVVRDVFARTTTGDDGTYEFLEVAAPEVPDRSGDRWTWEVLACSNNGAVGWNQLQRGYTAPTKVELQRDVILRPVRPLSGRLLSVDGKPVADAFVRSASLANHSQTMSMTDPWSQLNLNGSSLQLSVRTDASGTFVFPAVPDQFTATAFVRHPDHEFPSFRISSAETVSKLGAARTQDDGSGVPETPLLESPATVTAIPRIVIRGVLRNQSGAALAGKQVTVGSSILYAQTDSEGRFAWPTTEDSVNRYAGSGTEPATVRFYARSLGDNYVTLVHDEPLENIIASQPVTLTAQQGVIVSGSIQCAQDETPVEGVRVTVTPQEANASQQAVMATSDAQGRFRLVAPKLAVVATLLGPVPGFNIPSLRDANRVKLIHPLTRALDLTTQDSMEIPTFLVDRLQGIPVRVVDDQGNPVPSANVTAHHQERRSPSSTWRMQRDLSEPALTNARGIATLYPSLQRWDDGEVRVQGTVNGETWFGSQTLLPESEQPITITLKRPWRITGRVTLDGKPAPNVFVRLTRRVDDRSRLNSMTMRHLQSLYTGADGQYEFFAAPDEDYRVSIVEPPAGAARSNRAYIPKLIADNHLHIPDMELSSLPGKNGQPTMTLGKITGTVSDTKGDPIAGAQIQLAQYLGENIDRSIQAQYPVAPVKTDEDGRFEIVDMPPGTARLHIYPSRDDSDTKFITTFIVAEVGSRDVDVVVDPSLVREIPRLAPVRVVPTQSQR